MTTTETHPLVVDGLHYVLKFDRRPDASRFILIGDEGEVVARGLIDGSFNPPAVLCDNGRQLTRPLLIQVQSRWAVCSRSL